MKYRKIAFIDPGHRSAEMYAKCVNADIYTIKFKNRLLRFVDAFVKAIKIPKNSYDVYLLGTIEAMLFNFVRKIIYPDEKALYIVRVNDERFNIQNKFKQYLVLVLAKYADAFIAISERVLNSIKKYIRHKKILIVGNFVIKSDFFRIYPDLKNNNNILIVGRYKKMKGIDIALRVFNAINFNAELYIVGVNEDDLHEDLKFLKNSKKQKIHIMGYIDNWEEVAKKCKFYLHPGRGDAGGNSVLESMAVGLIPIVSSHVGNKEFVEKVDKGLVVGSLNPYEYTEILTKLYKEDIKNLKKLSVRCKKVAMFRNRDIGLQEFRDKLYKLLEDLL